MNLQATLKAMLKLSIIDVMTILKRISCSATKVLVLSFVLKLMVWLRGGNPFRENFPIKLSKGIVVVGRILPFCCGLVAINSILPFIEIYVDPSAMTIVLENFKGICSFIYSNS